MSEISAKLDRYVRGFNSIYRQELATWFSSSKWINQLIIWSALTLAPLLTIPPDNHERGVSVLTLFLWAGSNIMSIGTIIIAQGTIVEEKLTQTLMWIFSKPLSSAGFILGKFAAHAIFIGAIVLGIPSILAYIIAMSYGLPANMAIFNYFMGVAMLYLVLLFALALTLLLGALSNKIATVTALSLVIFFSGSSLRSTDFRWLEPYTVWALQHHAYEITTGNFRSAAGIAVVSAIGSIGILLAAAIVWMKRSEL